MMFVAVVKLELHFPYCQSLKEKRHFVKRIKGRLLSRFGVVGNEVGFLDKWQRSEIGFSLVGGDQRHLQSLMDRIISWILESDMGELIDSQQEVISW